MKDFNNYEILKKIGEGAQGEVYLAKDKRLGRKVAIKSLHIDLVTNTVLKERFIGEAKLLGQLSHPSIVTLFDYVVDNSGYHLVMEYLKGNQLDDYIKNISGPINEIRAIDIFTQILDGISHIHKLNIVHRDIKPSNIIIDQNDQIKLLDFGIAKDYNNDPNLTVVGQSVGGTPMYMSPEHISNAKITVQSDIYSLGVTFWHMLTGKAPYEGQSLAKIYSQIENEELEIIQKIYPYASKKVNDIIKKATNKNPKKRYDSCKSFKRALLELKEILIKKDSKSQKDIKILKNIDLRVSNVDDVSFIVNNLGYVGSELTFSGKPGDKLEIKLHKEGYDSVSKELIINQDELIEFELKKRMPVFFNLALIPFYFILFIYFKIILLIVNKGFLKLDETKKNIFPKKLISYKSKLNQYVNSLKSGLLELSSFFVFTIIILLIFNINRSENEILLKNISDPILSLDKNDEEKLLTNDKSSENSKTVEIVENSLDSLTSVPPKSKKTTKKFPKRGLIYKKGGCKRNTNLRIYTYHDGKGGFYNGEVYDKAFCGYDFSPIKNSKQNNNSNKNLNSSISSDFQDRLKSNVHDFYTDSFNGWKLIIDKSGSDIEIRAYKNGKFFHKYDIKGQLSSISFNSSSNTLNTNWVAGAGKRRHLINLNNTSIPKVSRVDIYWSRKNLEIELKSN
jgi:serine/threonine protein kinase